MRAKGAYKGEAGSRLLIQDSSSARAVILLSSFGCVACGYWRKSLPFLSVGFEQKPLIFPPRYLFVEGTANFNITENE